MQALPLLTKHQWIDIQQMDVACAIVRHIAHKLNNHLFATSISLDSLSHLVDPGSDAGEDVELLGRAQQNLQEATSRLQLFARGEKHAGAAQSRLLQLKEEEASLASLVAPMLALHIEYPPAPHPPLALPPEHLFAILKELCTNAREAAKEPMTLSIRIFPSTLKEGEVSGVAAGPYTVLHVSQPQAVLSSLAIQEWFFPFRSTKPKHTGLGLSVIYGYIRQAKGAIRVAHGEGVGTSTAVYLPHAKA